MGPWAQLGSCLYREPIRWAHGYNDPLLSINAQNDPLLSILETNTTVDLNSSQNNATADIAGPPSSPSTAPASPASPACHASLRCKRQADSACCCILITAVKASDAAVGAGIQTPLPFTALACHIRKPLSLCRCRIRVCSGLIRSELSIYIYVYIYI